MSIIIQDIKTDFLSSLPYIFKIFVSCICGALIGYERSKRQKDAGIRTHIIVCMGAALMMIISKYAFNDVLGDAIKLDPSRIAANVITGISFLGAGVIFIKDSSIKGLTTAAGIWATSAIGLAIGAGLYTISIVSTIIMLILQFVLHKFFNSLENTSNEFQVTMVNSKEGINTFKDILESNGITVQNMKMSKNSDSSITLNLLVKKPRSVSMENVFMLVEENENIISIDI